MGTSLAKIKCCIIKYVERLEIASLRRAGHDMKAP